MLERPTLPTEETFLPLTILLEGYYPDWEGTKQLRGTAKRLSHMFQDFCWPEWKIEKALEEHTKLFEDGYEELLTVEGIDIVTLCPHHLLPCRLKVAVSYAPRGKVLGLSKFARIAEILGKRPIMQETYTRELAECLWTRTSPKMVEVRVKGVHGCITFRGAKQEHTEVETIVCLPRGGSK